MVKRLQQLDAIFNIMRDDKYRQNSAALRRNAERSGMMSRGEQELVEAMRQDPNALFSGRVDKNKP